MLGPIHKLMARFLGISGHAWSKKQQALAANGQPRSWRILEAAKCEDVNLCMKSLLSIVLTPVSSAKKDTLDCCHRLQRFAMVAAGVCALHSYLRVPREGLPYQLFRLLSDASPGLLDSLLQHPVCMRDELSHVLMTRYERQLREAEGLAVLEGLAEIISVDVANIEAGHSTAREFANLRSRGWTSSLESICSRFILQQRLRVLGKAHDKKKTEKPVKKKKRGGGGPWRAFAHVYLRGRKLTPELAAEMAAAYKDLSDEERRVYEESGQAATRAHKMGLPSFPRVRSVAGPEMELPGQEAANGAMVAADMDADLLAVADFSGDTLAEKFGRYKEEVAKQLKAKANAHSFVPTREEQVALARFEAEAPPFMPAVQWERDGYSDLAVSVTKIPPAPSSTTTPYSWCPPVEKIVTAAGSLSVFRVPPGEWVEVSGYFIFMGASC